MPEMPPNPSPPAVKLGVGYPDDYVISRETLSVEPYGIMLNKNDPVFKQAVDTAIIGLFRSGEFARIYHRWFEQPIPGQGINLKLPMSDALKAVVQRPLDSADPEDYHARRPGSGLRLAFAFALALGQKTLLRSVT